MILQTIIGFVVQIFMAFSATIGFSILFNVPKKELAYCGASGGFGWIFYQLTVYYSADAVVGASFAAALAVTVISRVLCYKRKMPVSIYMISGVIPLVPGAGIYYTMFNMVNGENASALLKGIETLKIAGVIAIGLLAVLSLPRKMFDWKFKDAYKK